MEFLDLGFASPEENLACDEALLDWREQAGGTGILRFWESSEVFVVAGYANKIREEVNVNNCQAENIGIFRRCSGGGTVLQGPGCLNYALILPIAENTPLAEISGANKYIMERNRQAIQSIAGERRIEVRGHTDLTAVMEMDGERRRGALAPAGSVFRPPHGGPPPAFRKFSGNSQRRHKAFLLFHGTFLLRFNLELIERFLTFPSRQPEYRNSRSHGAFLMNLDLSGALVKEALKKVWKAERPLGRFPADRIGTLARQKYATPDWNLKFFHL